MVCDLIIQPPLFLPSLALDSGNPCQNDEVGSDRLHNLEFIRYLFANGMPE